MIHRLILALCLTAPMLGCPSTTSPPAPAAPGYLNSTDQTIGESLAAVVAFVQQEKINYAAETPVMQGQEKPYLNGLITAVDAANTAYLTYHASPTAANLTAASNALTNAQQAQAQLAKAKGVN